MQHTRYDVRTYLSCFIGLAAEAHAASVLVSGLAAESTGKTTAETATLHQFIFIEEYAKSYEYPARSRHIYDTVDDLASILRMDV